MKVPNNNLPPFAEQVTIQQKIKIPTNFIELKILKKNNWGSTEGLDKPLCERYTFQHNDKLITFDIIQELRETLGLEPNKNCSYPIYIHKELLNKVPDQGGITIDQEKNIICLTEGTFLLVDKEIQVDFTSDEINNLKQELKLTKEIQIVLERVLKNNEEKQLVIITQEEGIKELIQKITELRTSLEQEITNKKDLENYCRKLERTITKLKEDEQILIALQNNFSELQNQLGNQIITLTTEKDNVQGELNNLQTQLGRMRWKFLNTWFRKNEKSKKITDLKVRIVRLTAELFDKNQQIVQLNTQKDNLQTQLTTSNQTNDGLNNQIVNLNDQIAQLTTERNTLQTQLNAANQINTNLAQERSDLQIQLNDANNLIANTLTKLNINNINDLNNIIQLSPRETVTSLLNRPTQAQLTQVQSNYNHYYQKFNDANSTIASLRNELRQYQEIKQAQERAEREKREAAERQRQEAERKRQEAERQRREEEEKERNKPKACFSKIYKFIVQVVMKNQ